MAEDSSGLREVVAQVAAAYFSNSPVSPSEIPNVLALITNHFATIGAAPAALAEPAEAQPASTAATAAQIRKSVTHEALISFEDGRPYKTLRRHLSVHGLTPEQYREKWGLPPAYPMVAAAYSAKRSALARSFGLGQLRTPAASAPAPRTSAKAAAAKPAAARKVASKRRTAAASKTRG